MANRSIPSPLSLLVFCGRSLFREYGWQFFRRIAFLHPLKTARAVRAAAAFTASYSPKCVRHAGDDGRPAAVRVHAGSLDNPGQVLMVAPCRQPSFAWREFPWLEAREAIRAEARGVNGAGAG